MPDRRALWLVSPLAAAAIVGALIFVMAGSRDNGQPLAAPLAPTPILPAAATLVPAAPVATQPAHRSSTPGVATPFPTQPIAATLIVPLLIPTQAASTPNRAPAATLTVPVPAGTPAPAQVQPPEGSAPTPATTPPSAAQNPAATPQDPLDNRAERTLRGLESASDDDLVGQLLLLGWPGNTGEDARATIEDLRPAGLVYVGNTSSSAQATSINTSAAGIAERAGVAPLFFAVDHEGGTVQRITDVRNLGSNAAFAAGKPSDADACERGQTHAQQLRSMGFNMNLAPVLDVNNNPQNPVIGVRSYGPDPQLVARLGSAYVRGLQGGGIIAVGKHFPGHGNTGVDSHLQLPSLPLTEDELELVELVPFRRAIEPDTNIAAIMSAHIVFPAIEPSGVPATLSERIITGLLRNKLGFDGLVLSDDLAGMKAITDNFGPGDAAVRAIRAGIDLLIIAGGTERQTISRDALVHALSSGELDRSRVVDAARHVLEVKARFGLLGDPQPTLVACSN